MPTAVMIPPHEHPLFRFSDIAGPQTMVKAYYHAVADFIPYHTHDFYEINMVTDGVGTHRLATRDIATRRGDVFVIPPHMKHGYAGHRDLTVYHILLSRRFTDILAPWLESMPSYRLLFNVEPLLRGRTDTAFYIQAADLPFAQIEPYLALIGDCLRPAAAPVAESAQVAHTLSLIARLCSAADRAAASGWESLSEQVVLSVLDGLDYIEHHCAETVDFSALARQSACSYSTWLRRFKEITGRTPAAYQTVCRLNKAATLLLTTSDTLLEIALTCGFYDTSHFIRTFVKFRGQTPTAYRKAAAPA